MTFFGTGRASLYAVSMEPHCNNPDRTLHLGSNLRRAFALAHVYIVEPIAISQTAYYRVTGITHVHASRS